MIRLMRPDDIAAAMRLKRAAGWNQAEQDWTNVLAIEPQGCWVYETDGQVVGSTTAICYGEELGWIGMVLVLPEFRLRGYARALMEHALEFLRQRRVRVARLDATDMGHPLYERLGFEDECPIERWEAPASRNPIPQPIAKLSVFQDVASVAALDGRAFGADRQTVLKVLAGCSPAECLSTAGGFAMARPGSGSHFLGPCVAEDALAARNLIEALLSCQAGHSVFWDLLPENHEAVRLARELGFEPKRRLVRMALGEAGARDATRSDTALQFATAGFEYG